MEGEKWVMEGLRLVIDPITEKSRDNRLQVWLDLGTQVMSSGLILFPPYLSCPL